MFHFLKKFIQPRLQALNTIEIDRQTILNNLVYLQSLRVDHAVFPVLKSNAYGHGLRQISTILKDSSVPYICVDSFPEYQIVKDFSNKKVLVMGETFHQNYRYYNHRHATLVVYTLPTLKALAELKVPFCIHLFLNT